MGRPVKDIDADQVAKLAGIGCTLEEIAVVLDCNERTLRRRFVRAINEGRLNARASLRRKQWETANGTASTTTTRIAADGAKVVTSVEGRAPSAAMQIWLGKQLLGQKDKAEVTGADGGPIETRELAGASDAKLDHEIAKLSAAIQGLAEAVGDEGETGGAATGEAAAAG